VAVLEIDGYSPERRFAFSSAARSATCARSGIICLPSSRNCGERGEQLGWNFQLGVLSLPGWTSGGLSFREPPESGTPSWRGLSFPLPLEQRLRASPGSPQQAGTARAQAAPVRSSSAWRVRTRGCPNCGSRKSPRGPGSPCATDPTHQPRSGFRTKSP
jgi:hypothetical protein